MLVIATPDRVDARRVVQIARTLNPRIEIVARTHRDGEAALLEKDIGGKVFMGEQELAAAMARHVLDRYGGAKGGPSSPTQTEQGRRSGGGS
jgi:CPA2 family monovalent cation:H+ antiporter-2